MAVLAAPARRPWTRHLNRSVVAGLLCALLLAAAVARLATLWIEPKVSLLVTTADLPLGVVVQEAHLATTEATLDATLAAGYVPRGELAAVVGQPLRQAVQRGTLLPRAAVSGSAPFAGGERLSQPVRAEYAVGGALAAGDVVRVVQVRGERAETVLERAPLVAVQPGLTVTFLLPPAEADRLIVARARGELQLVLLPPGAQP